MAEIINGRKRIRKKFGSIREVAAMPNLIEVQKSSYDDFLLVKEPPGGRPDDQGIQAVFKSVFPISDFSGKATLEFVVPKSIPNGSKSREDACSPCARTLGRLR